MRLGLSLASTRIPAVLDGGLGLLRGEEQGFAIDATMPSGVGSLAIVDTTTAANNRSNISLYDSTSPLTNAGTSPKLVDTSDGTLEWSPHNLVLQSQTFNSWALKTKLTVSSDVIAAPDGTVTADKLVEASDTAENHFIQSALITSIDGATYTAVIYAKAAERSWINLRLFSGAGLNAFFDLTNGVVGTVGAGVTASIEDAGNGWYKCKATRAAAATSFYHIIQMAEADNDTVYDGDGASGVYVWGAQLNRGSVPTTYLPTTTAAVIGVPVSYDIANSQYGILSEPAATNLQVYSQEFDNAAWTATNATVSANAVVAPDGTTTADTLTDDATSGTHRVYDAITLATATPATFSVYAKAGTHNYLVITYVTTVDNVFAQVFDLSDGSVGQAFEGATTGTITDATITSLGNGWYRCTVTGSVTGANGFFGLSFAPAKTGNTFSNSGYVAYSGTGTTLHLWGAQAETGTVATSPIKTFASTVTRAADDIKIAQAAFPWNGGTGALKLNGSTETAETTGTDLDVSNSMDTAGLTYLQTLTWIPS